VVVDDGSLDDTPRVVKRCADLPIRYFRLNHAGKAAAKNLALFASIGKIVLFFDDDDVAGRDMLQEHLDAHAGHTEDSVAILGYTTWSAALEETPVMNYITSVGKNLFSYGSFHERETLGFTHFWEGRLSCKRSFLATRGIHNQDLEYLVDIELGYRLSRQGLAIVYHPRAISYMNRPLSFREFCRRCEAKGRALHQLWRLHGDDYRIREYCAPNTHQDVCAEFESNAERLVSRVRKLEGQSRDRQAPEVLRELHELYHSAFAGSLSRGFIAAQRLAE
jgi:glycosyltransferase involved in cell wall biosynthesis